MKIAMRTLLARSLKVGAVVALAMTAVPAYAQSAPVRVVPDYRSDSQVDNNITRRGGELDPSIDTPDSLAKYDSMIRFGGCTSKIAKSRVKSLLAEAPMSNSATRKANELYDSLKSCGTGLSRIASLRRGSLSEGYYLRSDADIEALRIAMAQPNVRSAFQTYEIAWNADRPDSDQTMIAATNCLVSADPRSADAVMHSLHGSDEELRALDALFMADPSCAGPTRPMSLSISFLRAFVADSLLRALQFDPPS